MLDSMDHSTEHVREISSTLYRYHLDNFLCDVFVVLPDGTEVPAHSVVLSAVSLVLFGHIARIINRRRRSGFTSAGRCLYARI